MVATLGTAGEDQVYEVSAVDISQLDTKLVAAKEIGKLFWHCLQEHLCHDVGGYVCGLFYVQTSL